MRSVVVRLTVYPVIVYVTIGAALFFEQDRLLFPAPKHFDPVTPANHGLAFEDLRIPVNARDQVHAWWLPGASTAATQRVILALHGNGYVLEDMVWEEASQIHDIGADALLIDYRGYGSSSPAHANESTVDEDAAAALDYLARRRVCSSSAGRSAAARLHTLPRTILASAG